MLFSNQTYPSISLLSPYAKVRFFKLYEILAVSLFTSADHPQLKVVLIFHSFVLGGNINVLLSIAEHFNINSWEPHKLLGLDIFVMNSTF